MGPFSIIFCIMFFPFSYFRDIDVPRNEGGPINKGRAFIEYAKSEQAARVKLTIYFIFYKNLNFYKNIL